MIPCRGIGGRAAVKLLNLLRARFIVTDAKANGTGFLTDRVWDAVVVGGGHNGLTAAAYLARAGLQVAVLERRHVLGGAAVTEEVVPGFKFSRASYLQSLLRPGIIQELDLYRHGLKLLPRNPSSFTPTVGGRFLLMGPDSKLNEAEISKFSKADAIAYPKYEEMLEKFCAVMDPLLDTVPPEAGVGRRSLQGRVLDGWLKTKVLGGLLKRSADMEQREMAAFLELLLAPASKVLNRWFESDVLKATLATDAVIGAMASVHTPGSGYVLLHHVMGETDGVRGIWSYVEGGVGSVSMAIARAAAEAGATLATNVEAAQFSVEDKSGAEKQITGVVLADGTIVQAKQVLSNATPAVTFLKLMPKHVLPEEFLSGVKSIDYKSWIPYHSFEHVLTEDVGLALSTMVLFILEPIVQRMEEEEDAAIMFTKCWGFWTKCMEEIDVAYNDGLQGRPSTRPLIEMTIPSVLDSTIAPPGEHVINLFIQYTPFHLKDGDWQDEGIRDAFAMTCFDLVDEYAPGFTASIVGYDMLTPPDLERVLGLTGRTIFQGAMGLDILLLSDHEGRSGYQTPVKGLYMCGAGSHPGGGVMGAPGRNAASVVLKDRSKQQ